MPDEKLFNPAEPWRKEQKKKAHALNQDYNRLYEDETEERESILASLLGFKGEGVFLQGPITFHYGSHTRIGKGTFINFNFTCQDDAPVTIGENCNFGPNVTIVTPLHPMLKEERKALLAPDGSPVHLCWAEEVHIGNDCWLGASVTVCPGVTIGDGCVIGAGSVVTRSIPAGSFAAGVPARVIRPLTEADSLKNRPDILGSYRVIE